MEEKYEGQENIRKIIVIEEKQKDEIKIKNDKRMKE